MPFQQQTKSEQQWQRCQLLLLQLHKCYLELTHPSFDVPEHIVRMLPQNHVVRKLNNLRRTKALTLIVYDQHLAVGPQGPALLDHGHLFCQISAECGALLPAAQTLDEYQFNAACCFLTTAVDRGSSGSFLQQSRPFWGWYQPLSRHEHCELADKPLLPQLMPSERGQRMRLRHAYQQCFSVTQQQC